MQDIKFVERKELKKKPAPGQPLGFGDIFTDYMFLMDYTKGKGWHDARIVPYGPIELDPAAMVLHYSQEIFEGLKAYRTKEGKIQLFRPRENFKRLNESGKRLSIPPLDEALALRALKELVELEKDWVPGEPDTSLYIRPFIFTTDAHLGVRPGNEYLFMIILSPVGAYYEEGLNPVKIYIEPNYVRTVRGGTGTAKTGGNYAASLNAQVEAHDQNYSQVLWLDGVERKYVEEVGSMNVFFVIGGEVITPKLSGSILAGITRKSAMEMLTREGYKVVERALSIDEIIASGKDGSLKEAFGTGTAAVISPIGYLKYGDMAFEINRSQIGPISQMLYDKLTGMQYGKLPDTYGWIEPVC